MINLRLFILTFSLLALVPDLSVGQQSSPGSPDFVLKEIEKIEQQRESLLKTGVAQAYATLSKAARSDEAAVSLYEDAVRATRFAGLGRETSQFRDWRTGPGDALGTAASKKALRYHLQYMIYTLQRATGEEVEKLMPSVLAHAIAVRNDLDAIEITASLNKAIERQADNPVQRRRLEAERKEREFSKRLLDEGVAGSPIAKYLAIDGELAKAEDWPASAGAIDQMYQMVILPEFRRLKDSRLIAYWDDRIRRESEKAAQGGTDFEASAFQRVRKPSLLWKRAEDLAAIGDVAKSFSEKLSIIRANPLHPEAGQWIESVKASAARLKGGAPNPGAEADPVAEEAGKPEA